MFLTPQPPVGHGPLIHEVFVTHSDTPHSVGLLRTSDQLVAETSNWPSTTLTTEKYPNGTRNHNLNRRAAADLRLRLRDHWDRTKIATAARHINYTGYSCANK